MNTMARARTVALLLLLLVAAAGFAAGVATERMILTRDDDRIAVTQASEAPEGVRVLLRGRDAPVPDGGHRVRVLLPELAEQLDLTDEQRLAIERILTEDQAAIREITADMQPALLDVIERTRRRIHEVLTDEQIARWHASPMLRLRRGPPEPEPG